MAGRPPGATNKVKAGKVFELLSAKGVNLVDEAMKLLENGDDMLKFQVVKMLMKYVYAERRPEDELGNPEEMSVITAPLSNDEIIDLVKQARGKK